MFKGQVKLTENWANSRTLSARFCERIEGCGIKVEEKIVAFLVS
jgi:hypothetical protein